MRTKASTHACRAVVAADAGVVVAGAMTGLGEGGQ